MRAKLVCLLLTTLTASAAIQESFENVAIVDPFDGTGDVTWVGDVGEFEITTSTWPTGQDMAGDQSLRALGHATNPVDVTVVTDISGAYSSAVTMRWDVYVSCNAAAITSGRGFSLILLSDSATPADIAAGNINGYRLTLIGSTDTFHLERADNGGTWSSIDSLVTGPVTVGDGFNISVERTEAGVWNWGYASGAVDPTSVSLSESHTDNTHTSGSYAGMRWFSPASSSNGFGFDNFRLTAREIFESWEGQAELDPFAGAGDNVWTGDVGQFEVTTDQWPSGTTADFDQARSMRSRIFTVTDTATVLTDVSDVFHPLATVRWEVYVGGNSASITTSRGFALLLFADSATVADIEAGTVNGYRLRVIDPSGSNPDGVYLEKASGSGWVVIDDIQLTGLNVNQGWNLAITRSRTGEWNWGYTNGTIDLAAVTLTEAITDADHSTATSAGMAWESSATDSNDFGFDHFRISSTAPPVIGTVVKIR